MRDAWSDACGVIGSVDIDTREKGEAGTYVDTGVVEFLVLRIGRGAVVVIGVMGGVGRALGNEVTRVAGVMVITGDSGTESVVGILMQSGVTDGSDDMMVDVCFCM